VADDSVVPTSLALTRPTTGSGESYTVAGGIVNHEAVCYEGAVDLEARAQAGRVSGSSRATWPNRSSCRVTRRAGMTRLRNI